MRRTGKPFTTNLNLSAARRGEVWLAWLDKVRPIVVLSRDPMGQLLQAVISAPVTSTIRGLSTEIRLGREDGLRVDSVANLDNVHLVARTRLVRRVGRAKPRTMQAICDALSTAAGCA